MFLVIGLGNPGEEYARTRHNAGFIILDALVGEDGWHQSKGARALIKEVGDTVYVKPETYMNKSGEAVAYLLKKYSSTTEKMLIIHDELDVPVGEMKISFNKGTGGNNGVDSIHSVLGTKEYIRIRLGVGTEFAPKDRASFVLKPFTKEEYEKLIALVPQVEKAITTWQKEGREKMLSTCN